MAKKCHTTCQFSRLLFCLAGLIIFASASAQSISIDVSVTPSSCNKANGRIDATASGGTAPFEYSIGRGGYQSSGTFQWLEARIYVIVVRDANGLLMSRVMEVTNRGDAPVIESVDVESHSQCGVTDAHYIVRVRGGSAPYSYSLDHTNWQADNHFYGLPPGMIRVYVRDARGCETYIDQASESRCALTLAILELAHTCSNLGYVSGLIGGGGTGPYKYAIDGGLPSVENSFDSLAPGIHELTLEDALGSTAIFGVQIRQECVLQMEVEMQATVCGEDNGAIRVLLQGGQAPFSFRLNGGTPQTDPLFNGLAAGDYSVNVEDALGNLLTEQVTILEQTSQNTALSAGRDTSICIGASTTLQVTGGEGAIQWQPAEGLDNPASSTPIASPDKSTTYYVSRSNGGCTEKDSVTVTVLAATVYAGNDTIIRKTDSAMLEASDPSGLGLTAFSWTPAHLLSVPTIFNPIAFPEQDQRFVVTATNAAGCEGTDDVLVKVVENSDIYVPSAFTPNKDQRNDLFQAVPIGLRRFDYLRVFNRLGQEIFSTTDAGIGWDGNWRGQLQPGGLYIWQVSGIDILGKPIIKKGTVLLLR